VVSVDELKTGSDRDGFVVVPISATEPESLMRPTIAPADSGLDRPSVAVPSAVRAVSRQRLLRHVGTVGPDVLGAVEHALAIVLGIDE
jgi:mRNA-degrading endonuclease toxin of MazEF toxin-antitoxin module